jgi:hypothetical protein
LTVRFAFRLKDESLEATNKFPEPVAMYNKNSIAPSRGGPDGREVALLQGPGESWPRD